MFSNIGTETEPRWVRLNAIDSVEYSETGGCLVTLRSGRELDCPHPVSEVMDTLQQKPVIPAAMPPHRTVAGQGPAAGMALQPVERPRVVEDRSEHAVSGWAVRQRQRKAWRAVVQVLTGPLVFTVDEHATA